MWSRDLGGDGDLHYASGRTLVNPAITKPGTRVGAAAESSAAPDAADPRRGNRQTRGQLFVLTGIPGSAAR